MKLYEMLYGDENQPKNNKLPSINDLSDGMTKGELAKQLYSGQTYDVSLPQKWVNDFKTKTGFDPVSQVVWLYTDRDSIGRPAPLTKEAKAAIEKYNKK